MENKILLAAVLLLFSTRFSAVFSQDQIVQDFSARNGESARDGNIPEASATAADTEKKIKELTRHLESTFPGTDRRFISALLSSERGFFIPEEFREYSYIDISLPAGGKKTVVSYSDLLKAFTAVRNKNPEKVLIIGRNAGFAASAFSLVFENVFLIELDTAEREKYSSYYAEKFPQLTAAFSEDREYFIDDAPFDLVFFNGALVNFRGEYINLVTADGEIIFPMKDRDGFQLLYRAVRDGNSYSLSVVGEVFFPEIE